MFSFTLNRTSLIRSPELASGVLADVLLHARSLCDLYPDFELWLSNKVLAGLDKGERTILAEYREGYLAGFAIVKDDGAEKKLCCLRILEQFQNSRGMGIRLFERAFDELSCDKPLLSVAEERINAYSRIFNYFGFELTAKYNSIYRPGKIEYVHNGFLDTEISPLHIPSNEFYCTDILTKQTSLSS